VPPVATSRTRGPGDGAGVLAGACGKVWGGAGCRTGCVAGAWVGTGCGFGEAFAAHEIEALRVRQTMAATADRMAAECT